MASLIISTIEKSKIKKIGILRFRQIQHKKPEEIKPKKMIFIK